MPVSRAPLGGGKTGAFPHLVDRYKPGVIAVGKNGRRFANEANSYHDFGEAMIRASETAPDAVAWLICDHRALRKYGLGYVKPAPVPFGRLLRTGYLLSARSLASLAQAAGIDPGAFVATIREFNLHAEDGADPEFGRGSNAFNRYLADSRHRPNPCVGPIKQAPFYAVKLLMGDLGTFDGIETDSAGRVLDLQRQPIGGLYAAGADCASVMGGNYPGAGINLGPTMTFGYIIGRTLAGV